MDGDTQRGQVHGFGAAAGEHLDMLRQRQFAGDGALRIVVALDNEDGDVGTAQAHHLGAKK